MTTLANKRKMQRWLKEEKEREERELLEASKIEAQKQRAARGGKLEKLLRSSQFQAKFKELSGYNWDDYCTTYSPDREQIKGLLTMFKSCVELKRTYGKYFDSKTPIKGYGVGCMLGFHSIERAMDDLYELHVDYLGVRLHNWSELSGRQRRYVMFKLASPAWRDKEKIARIYSERDKITAETGVAHHVDHVIPIQGDKVCGLHVHQNLEVIDAVENIVKKNKFEIE